VANAGKPDERAGWEMIWRRGDDHPRYGVSAAPNPAVVEWVESVSHVVCLAERGFRMAGVDISPSGILARGSRDRQGGAHDRFGDGVRSTSSSER